jgi:hypothetical protein
MHRAVFVPFAAQVILASHSDVDFGRDPLASNRDIVAIAANIEQIMPIYSNKCVMP